MPESFSFCCFFEKMFLLKLQVSIEASCVSGFEVAGQAEVRDTFGIEATKHQVRIRS
jgi:hypothetical protein